MVWRIGRAKPGAICHFCQLSIRRDQYRFGNWDLGRWYHLECAVERNPRSFEPFAERAAKLLAAPPTPDAPIERPSNRELEARLRANPDDDATRAVYADWLQSIGDPWGELIVMELAGKDARSLLRDNLDTLIGALPPRMFEWRRGFIHKVLFPPRMALNVSHDLLLEVLALRTTMLVRELHFPNESSESSVELINRARTLRSLVTWFSKSVGYALALPELEELTVNVSSDLGILPGIPLDDLEHALRDQRFELRMP